MPSKRKHSANRRNAQKSTGPTSEKGKAISSLNAVRHGLSSQIVSDPETEALVDRLAREFLDAAKRDVSAMGLARAAAEAQIQMFRIQNIKRQAWGPSSSDYEINQRGNLRPLLESENRKYFKARMGLPVGELRAVMPYAFEEPFGSDEKKKLAFELAATKRLQALVRYERQFSNRRDRALRALNEHVA